MIDGRLYELNDRHTAEVIRDIASSYQLYFQDGYWTSPIWKQYVEVNCEQVVDIFNGKVHLGGKTLYAVGEYLEIVPKAPHEEGCDCIECEMWGILSSVL